MGIYDPHKICALEADQKKMKEDLHEYKHMVREFEKVDNHMISIHINSHCLGPKEKDRGLGNKNHKQSRVIKTGRQ